MQSSACGRRCDPWDCPTTVGMNPAAGKEIICNASRNVDGISMNTMNIKCGPHQVLLLAPDLHTGSSYVAAIHAAKKASIKILHVYVHHWL